MTPSSDHRDADVVASQRSLRVTWADTDQEIAEAQRLRYQIFVEEMGASLRVPAQAPAAHDVDSFDEYCMHLMVRAGGTPRHGELIATCRVMSPAAARRAGGLYAESEFDLKALRGLRPHMLELGRVCVHPSWRKGPVQMRIWRAVIEWMQQLRLDSVIGCCSVSLSDGGKPAVRLWSRLKMAHLVEPDLQVRPWSRLRLRALNRDVKGSQASDAAVPPLMQGYLRCGAKLLGPPAVDRAFKSVHFPILLRLKDVPSRYGSSLLGTVA